MLPEEIAGANLVPLKVRTYPGVAPVVSISTLSTKSELIYTLLGRLKVKAPDVSETDI